MIDHCLIEPQAWQRQIAVLKLNALPLSSIGGLADEAASVFAYVVNPVGALGDVAICDLKRPTVRNSNSAVNPRLGAFASPRVLNTRGAGGLLGVI